MCEILILQTVKEIQIFKFCIYKYSGCDRL